MRRAIWKYGIAYSIGFRPQFESWLSLTRSSACKYIVLHHREVDLNVADGNGKEETKQSSWERSKVSWTSH